MADRFTENLEARILRFANDYHLSSDALDDLFKIVQQAKHEAWIEGVEHNKGGAARQPAPHWHNMPGHNPYPLDKDWS